VIGARAGEWETRVIDGPPDGALRRLSAVLEDLPVSRREDGVVREAVRLVRHAQGRKRMDDLASSVNVSPRRLERHFIEHVGISAKTFSRLVRFDRVVRDIATRGRMSWAQFALAHGYTDQAHLINEFKEFAGITPTQFETESRLDEGPRALSAT
jgi:transcriptional regulator GlxA family with amidase domain